MNYQELCERFFFNPAAMNTIVKIGNYVVRMAKVPVTQTLTAIYHAATWHNPADEWLGTTDGNIKENDTGNTMPAAPARKMELLTMIANNNTIVMQPVPSFFVGLDDEWAGMESGSTTTDNAERVIQTAQKFITDEEIKAAETSSFFVVDAAAKNFFNGKPLSNVYTSLIHDMVQVDDVFVNYMQHLPDYEAAAKAWLATGNRRRLLAKDMKLERDAQALAEKWESELDGDIYRLRKIKQLTDGMKNVTVKFATAKDSITVKISTLAFSWMIHREGDHCFLYPYVDLWAITPESEMHRVCNAMGASDVPISKVLEITHGRKTIYTR